jgi:hypothetical protein
MSADFMKRLYQSPAHSGVPTDIDLLWLGRQRQHLGASRFAELLARHLDEENAAAVLSMLDRPSPVDPSPEYGS